MARSFSINADTAKEQAKAYQTDLSICSLEQLVQELFRYLDYTEESDSGREFHPITISSCRVCMSQPLAMLLEMLRSEAND